MLRADKPVGRWRHNARVGLVDVHPPSAFFRTVTGLRVEIANDRQFPRLRAEVFVVELSNLVVVNGGEAIDGFLDRRHVADVVLGVWGELAAETAIGQRVGLGPGLLHRCQPLTLYQLKLIGGKRRLAQHLAQDLEHCR